MNVDVYVLRACCMVYYVLVLAAAAAAECNTLCILYKTVVAHRHVVTV